MNSETDKQNDENPTYLRQALVEKLMAAGHIRAPRIESAFRNVPRHLFLPDAPIKRAYEDDAIITKRLNGVAVSSSSQPAIMAIMLEQLDLQPGHRVLEIGAGTGYNAALMSHIVGKSGQIVTIDIDRDIVENARANLREVGCDDVKVIHADGAGGYPENAPYDRIILTVSSWDIAPAWLEQLNPEGRLVLPLALRGGVQKSVAFDRANDYLESLSVVDCGFMTLRGAFAAPGGTYLLDEQQGLYITIDSSNRIDPTAIYESLDEPDADIPTGVYVTPSEAFGSLSLWLALFENGVCSVGTQSEAGGQSLIPWLIRWPSGFSTTFGIAQEASLSILIRSQEGRLEVAADTADSPPSELQVRGYGAYKDLAGQLVEQVKAWDNAGRPSSSGLRIRAYPKDAEYAPTADEAVISKRWTTLVVDWQD